MHIPLEHKPLRQWASTLHIPLVDGSAHLDASLQKLGLLQSPSPRQRPSTGMSPESVVKQLPPEHKPLKHLLSSVQVSPVREGQVSPVREGPDFAA